LEMFIVEFKGISGRKGLDMFIVEFYGIRKKEVRDVYSGVLLYKEGRGWRCL